MKRNDYSGLVLVLSYNFNNIQFCSLQITTVNRQKLNLQNKTWDTCIRGNLQMTASRTRPTEMSSNIYKSCNLQIKYRKD